MSISQNFPTDLPTLNLDFVNNQFLDPRITFTRTSSATYFNSSGVLTTAANNVPKFDYDPATLTPRGLLIEEQRTNSIRNNTMVGAAAGTPGTLPTNWVISGLGTLTQTVVGVGTINGISYIDIRFNGTTSSTQLGIRFEPPTGIAATNGQTWTFSTWCAIVGGGLTNITGIGANANLWDSGSTYLTSIIVGSVNITSTLNRTSAADTISTANTAFIQPQLFLVFNSGVAVDITLRIGLPQLEQGAFATSVIPTTNAAVTRNADVARMTGANFSSWFNPTQGTIFNISRQAQNRTTGYPTVVCISDSGSGINAIEQYWDNSSNFFASLVYTSSTLQTSIGRSGLTRTDVHENAFAYEANNFACSVSGGAVSTDNSGSIPTIDRLCIGSRFDGSLNFNGYIQRITYYPTRLSNTQLQALTL